MRNKQFWIWVAATVFFSIGFYHTGLGLREARVIDLKYGGFALAAAITIGLLLTFHLSMRRMQGAFWGFVTLAMFNVVCNFNYLWPNYAGKMLVGEEMADLQHKVAQLAARIKNDPSLPTLESLKRRIETARDALVTQVKTYGVGPEANRQMDSIESNLPGYKLSRQTAARGQIEWNRAAEGYYNEVNGILQSYLSSNRFDSLQRLRLDAEQTSDIQRKKLADAEAILKRPDVRVTPEDLSLISDTVQKLNKLCSDVREYRDERFRCDADTGVKDAEYPLSPRNVGLGSFGHTVSSALASLDKGSFWVVLAFCLLLDFIGPLILYQIGRDRRDDGRYPRGDPASIGT